MIAARRVFWEPCYLHSQSDLVCIGSKHSVEFPTPHHALEYAARLRECPVQLLFLALLKC
jgi:hypothetical protein